MNAQSFESDTVTGASSSANGVAAAELRGITKTYFKPDGSVLVEALVGIDLTVLPGEFVAIMGASGSGKSTLMNILGCLDQPTAGTYMLAGRDVAAMEDDELSRVRGQKIGFIFQAFNLINQLNTLENVTMPLFYQGVPRAERDRMALEKLELVGLSDRLTHRPNELSGGQQQRVAIARALVMNPSIIMADEPTGNLDSKTGAAILELISDLHDQGMTILVVTHDEAIAERCQRIIRLSDGRVESDTRVGGRRGDFNTEHTESTEGRGEGGELSGEERRGEDFNTEHTEHTEGGREGGELSGEEKRGKEQ